MKNTIHKTTAAAITSLVAASGAQGIIQHFDNSNEFSVGLGTTGNFNWDIDGVNGDDARWAVFGGGSYLYLSDNFGKSFGAIQVGQSLNNLASGYAVSGARTFGDFFSLIYSGVFSDLNDFSSGLVGNFGFRFNDGGGIVYGWANATFVSGGNGGVTVHEWAFQDDGSSIAVGDIGAVPEPATTAVGLGALALGAAGLRRWRKAKQAA